MKKKVLITMLSASLMCAVAAVAFAACGETKTYSVTYVKSTLNEQGDVPTDTAKYAEGKEVTVKGKGDLALTDYTFSGWTYGGKTYAEGDKIKMPAKDITLTASWTQNQQGEEPTKYTLSYIPGMGMFSGTPVTFEIAAGETVTVKSNTDLDIVAETGKYLKCWYEITDAENDVTVDYNVGSTFTMPEHNVSLHAAWQVESVMVGFYASEAATWTDEPIIERELNLIGGDKLTTLPTAADINYDGDLELFGWYLNEYTQLTTTYVFEESVVYAYPVYGKTIADYTANGWTNRASEKVDISYGQTVTVTGDLTVVKHKNNGTTMGGYEGIFVSIGKVGEEGVKVTRRYDTCTLTDGVPTWNDVKNTALGVKLTATNIVSDSDYVDVICNSEGSLAGILGTVTNYKVTVDYTLPTEITIVTTFTTTNEDGDTYFYIGKLLIEAIDAHVGLAETYTVGISGEAGSKLDNGKYLLGGEVKTWAAPAAGHDWTEENGYICTICGDYNPDHPHDYVEEVCTICGAVDMEHHTLHRYDENGGFCTVCGNSYQITVDGTTYTAALASTAITNNDTSGGWWDGKTSNIEFGEGNQIAVISWDKTRDADYYDIRLDISGEEGKDANDPWNSGGVFRLGPNVFEGVFTNNEQVVTTGTVPADGTDGASLGSYKGILLRVGNTLILSLQCYRDGALFWSQSVTVDLTNTNLPEGTLYYRVAANPTFCDNFTAATGTLAAAE